MTAFLEAHFNRKPHNLCRDWADHSTADTFIFESDFGVVSLRRRTAYPQTFAVREGHMLYCGYGNAVLGRSIAGQPLCNAAPGQFLDDEFLYIQIDTRQQQVCIQRDAINALPLFVGQQAGHFSISNQFGRVASALIPVGLHLDTDGLAASVAGNGGYGRTLAREICMLEDRARLEWAAGRTVITQASDNSWLYQAYQNPSGNPREFVERLESCIDRYAERYFGDRPVACELSGGYDSTLLAGYAADSGREVIAATMLYPGEFGCSQAAKLQAFKRRFKAVHHEVVMDYTRDFPLANRIRAGLDEPFYHKEELYQASIDGMLRYLSATGVPAVMRGIGGDELCQNLPPANAMGQDATTIERQLAKELPVFMTDTFARMYQQSLRAARPTPKALPLTAYSVISGRASGSNQYIEQGIWPVQPLADPALFNYCQGLPIRYRLNKAIIQAYLRARRFPEVIIASSKNQQEHFGEFFDLALVHNFGPVFAQYMDRPLLAHYGWLDTGKLLYEFGAACERVRRASGYVPEPVLFQAFNVLRVEMNARLLIS